MKSSPLSEHLRRGDRVVVGQVAAEPAGLVAELIALAPRIGPLEVLCGYSLNPVWERDVDPALRISAYCGLGTIRHQVTRGVARVMPAQLSQLGAHFASGKLCADAVLLQVAPADKDGFHSLGCALDYVWDAVQVARVVLVEVNPNMPPTRSACRLHRSRVVVARHSDAPLIELPREEPGEVQLRVGRQVAALVPDGATIQLGIGGLAAAVANALARHRGLKVRSGMVGDWFLDLLACGAIEPAERGVHMASLAVGSRALYQALARDDLIELATLARLVAPAAEGGASPFMAINSAIEVDLYGQANAEFVGERYVGAMGGQADYFRAARRSPGGLAIVALPATTGRDGKSRIVSRLAGAYVTSAQSDIDIIVTEHGAADIRATTLEERRMLIAQLADPRFRGALMKGEAHVAA